MQSPFSKLCQLSPSSQYSSPRAKPSGVKATTMVIPFLRDSTVFNPGSWGRRVRPRPCPNPMHSHGVAGSHCHWGVTWRELTCRGRMCPARMCTLMVSRGAAKRIHCPLLWMVES